jgi:hypothetical protein
MSDIERPDEMVSVPRWVLDELIPMALGARITIQKMKQAGIAADASDDEMMKGDRAIEVAYDALHPGEPS